MLTWCSQHVWTISLRQTRWAMTLTPELIAYDCWVYCNLRAVYSSNAGGQWSQICWRFPQVNLSQPSPRCWIYHLKSGRDIQELSAPAMKSQPWRYLIPWTHDAQQPSSHVKKKSNGGGLLHTQLLLLDWSSVCNQAWAVISSTKHKTKTIKHFYLIWGI